MRILLSTLNAKYIHTNLAIRLLYQLNRNREGLEWKEFTIKEDPNEIARFCNTFEVVCFSCYIWNITQTLAVCRLLKSQAPHVKILLGGPEVSYDWEPLMQETCIDYIIYGEGEIPFEQFLNFFPQVEQVEGLIYRKEGKPIQNPAPMQFDLNRLETVMPYRDDDPAELYNKVLYLETSRGCPYKCEFCLASLDNKVRYLPMDSIKATLLHMMQHGRVVKFLDRTFNVKKVFTLEIFEFILENHQPGNVFQFEITADILHPDIVAFIHERVPAGLFRFEIGIQTVNQKANLAVSRKQNFEKTKKIIQELCYKVEMHLDLIVGLPLDYWEDVKHSFEEVFSLFAPELQLGFLKFLKGTTMRDMEQHGFVYDPLPPYQIIESKYLSRGELAKITQLEHALEIYWNSGKCRSTLMYASKMYGSFDFLLELGVRFGARHSYHSYSLNDVFQTLHDFVSEVYKEDHVLRQLVSADYYAHFKVRPQQLFMKEIERQEKNKVIERLKLNYHKFRFMLLPFDFDLSLFLKEGIVEKKPSLAIFQYDGTNKAQVLDSVPYSVNLSEIIL